MKQNTATKAFWSNELSPEDVYLDDVIYTINELASVEVDSDNSAKIRHFLYGALGWTAEHGLIIPVPIKLLLSCDKSGTLFAHVMDTIDPKGEVNLEDLPDIALESLIRNRPYSVQLGYFNEEVGKRSAKFQRAMYRLYGVTPTLVGK